MGSYFRSFTIFKISLLVLVSGCVDGQYRKITQIPSENSLLRFYGESQRGSSPERVAYADPWEYEEYAAFKNGKTRLELFYITARDSGSAVEYPYHLRQMVGTWHFNAGKDKVWGISDSISSPLGEIYYDRFSQDNQSCAGFEAAWDDETVDPRIRPGKVVFGYLCADRNVRLSTEKIENTLMNIGIRGVTERIRPKDPSQITADFGEKNMLPTASINAAMRIANSNTAPVSGNRDFPFEFVVGYQESMHPQIDGVD